MRVFVVVLCAAEQHRKGSKAVACCCLPLELTHDITLSDVCSDYILSVLKYCLACIVPEFGTLHEGSFLNVCSVEHECMHVCLFVGFTRECGLQIVRMALRFGTCFLCANSQ
jgi:hypothetical protein